MESIVDCMVIDPLRVCSWEQIRIILLLGVILCIIGCNRKWIKFFADAVIWSLYIVQYKAQQFNPEINQLIIHTYISRLLKNIFLPYYNKQIIETVLKQTNAACIFSRMTQETFWWIRTKICTMFQKLLRKLVLHSWGIVELLLRYKWQAAVSYF